MGASTRQRQRQTSSSSEPWRRASSQLALAQTLAQTPQASGPREWHVIVLDTLVVREWRWP